MWVDLTVDGAEQIRDFYREVVGWTSSDVDMGGYHDYCMNQPEDGKTVAGICHARGLNAGLPPQWIVYVNVEDLERSMARCEALGGQVVAPPRDYGAEGRYAVVRDPAGAVFALFEPEDSAA
jgi:predicted enzyme related to lactoylglutathione lyase